MHFTEKFCSSVFANFDRMFVSMLLIRVTSENYVNRKPVRYAIKLASVYKNHRFSDDILLCPSRQNVFFGHQKEDSRKYTVFWQDTIFFFTLAFNYLHIDSWAFLVSSYMREISSPLAPRLNAPSSLSAGYSFLISSCFSQGTSSTVDSNDFILLLLGPFLSIPRA